MSFTESTPPEGEQVGPLPAYLQEAVLIQLEGDYSEGSAFGHRTLEVTSEFVRVRETNGIVAFQIPVAEIKEARNEPLVGGGRLEITAKNGDFFPILTYSSTVSAQFSEAARGIEQLSKGEPLSINLKQERTRCIKCNRLLCRFYEPDAGRILIDGIDYRDMELQAMRRQIGIVLQEPFLFNGTIAENIAYGKPGASLDEIMEAARAANAHNFVLSKPDGYNTMVGERGAKLSGGERQRISIARAILHNPRILILDEATSSVDVETEKQIQEAIGRLIQGRTTFAIAHRLSTLRNASRLIVIEKGQIAEVGTHAELMEKQGVFHSLVETQSQVTQILGVGEIAE